MSIASRIPTEILGEIFLHTIDGPISNIQDNQFPWALDRVCKSWRFAFVTYPYLWTWITITLAESHSREQDKLKAANQCLSLCLERSRNYPLNISLHMPIEGYDENSPSFTRVWQSFLSCSHRWRIVCLENVCEPQFITLNSCMGAIPILQSFIIHSPMDIIGCSDFTGFQIAPQLTRFTLRDTGAIFAVQKWSVPWMQLTKLVLRFEEITDADQLRVLFKQLRDIEELCLVLEGDEQIIDLGDFVHNSGTPQGLQHLRILQICCIEILGLITAPSLSELYLEDSDFFYQPMDDGDYEVGAEEILNSFIQRSSCKIRKLTLSDIPKYLFTPLVGLFPDVVELCLTDAMMCLDHLLSPDHLPELRVLDCTARRIDVKYFRTLLNIFKLRNSPSAGCSAVPLAKVIFRPLLTDGESLVQALHTTTDWASFESHVYVGSCCELNLPKHFSPFLLSPPSSPPAKNGSPNANIAPPPSTSTPSAPLNLGPMVSQQPVLLDTLFPPDFMQHLSNSLDDFDSNIFRNDGDINFERDFGQWFNEDDVSWT